MEEYSCRFTVMPLDVGTFGILLIPLRLNRFMPFHAVHFSYGAQDGDVFLDVTTTGVKGSQTIKGFATQDATTAQMK